MIKKNLTPILGFLTVGLFATLLYAIPSCTGKDPLPPGYELAKMSDGYYLRTNGIFIKQQKYLTREEAIGRAYLMASAAPDPSHVKLDAVITVEFGTNKVFDAGVTNQQIHRQVWVSFNVYGAPFKGLLKDDVVGVLSESAIGTNLLSR